MLQLQGTDGLSETHNLKLSLNRIDRLGGFVLCSGEHWGILVRRTTSGEESTDP